METIYSGDAKLNRRISVATMNTRLEAKEISRRRKTSFSCGDRSTADINSSKIILEEVIASLNEKKRLEEEKAARERRAIVAEIVDKVESEMANKKASRGTAA